MLSVECEYGFESAIGQLNKQFEPGRIYGLCGPNGSGKTTLARTIAGEIYPVGGTVTLDGTPTTDRTMVGRLAYISRPEFYPDLSVGEHIKLMEKYSGRDFSSSVEQWQLQALLKSPPARLSSGQQQRVYLATQLPLATEITLVDEPERHLDAGWVALCCTRLRDLADSGATVLVATHSKQIRETCDEIVTIAASL